MGQRYRRTRLSITQTLVSHHRFFSGMGIIARNKAERRLKLI
jgi:hypothetical protein